MLTLAFPASERLIGFCGRPQYSKKLPMRPSPPCTRTLEYGHGRGLLAWDMILGVVPNMCTQCAGMPVFSPDRPHPAWSPQYVARGALNNSCCNQCLQSPSPSLGLDKKTYQLSSRDLTIIQFTFSYIIVLG